MSDDAPTVGDKFEHEGKPYEVVAIWVTQDKGEPDRLTIKAEAAKPRRRIGFVIPGTPLRKGPVCES